MQQAEAYYQPDIISQTYIPRGQNVLQKIFKDHFEEFKTQYDEKYAKTYGNYRIVRITEVVEEFLKCGDYKIGHPWPIFLLKVVVHPVRQL